MGGEGRCRALVGARFGDCEAHWIRGEGVCGKAANPEIMHGGGKGCRITSVVRMVLTIIIFIVVVMALVTISSAKAAAHCFYYSPGSVHAIRTLNPKTSPGYHPRQQQKKAALQETLEQKRLEESSGFRVRV